MSKLPPSGPPPGGSTASERVVNRPSPSRLPVNERSLGGPPPGELPTKERPLSGPPLGGLPRDWLPALVAFLDREPAVVRIVVAEVRGSTPREPGAFMLVGSDGLEGSIGGGQLEWEATAGARELLLGTGPAARVNKVVLGPDVGQCCGGVVSVLLERFTRESLDLLRTASEAGARGCAVLSSTISQGGVGHSVVRRAATGTGGAVIGAVAAVTGAGGAVTRADRSVTGPHPGVAAVDLSADEASDRLLHEPRQSAHTIVTRKAAADIDDATDRLLREPRQSARPILTRNAAGEPTFLERLDHEFPAVWLYGAGHVGQALARILVELPLRLTWIDSRAELFPDTHRRRSTHPPRPRHPVDGIRSSRWRLFHRNVPQPPPGLFTLSRAPRT